MKAIRKHRAFRPIATLLVGILVGLSFPAYAAVQNRIMALQGYVGTNIASAAALPLGASVGNFFTVTGTTAVTSATVAASSASAGRVVTLYFSSAGCQLSPATSLILRGPFISGATSSPTGGSSLTLYCDGTAWREIARANEGFFTKACDLTEAAATSFADVGIASGDHLAGYVEYSIYATDGTDFQVRSGIAQFAAVNKAGTVTAANFTESSAVAAAALSSGTETSAITAVAGTLKITLKTQPVSSLTQTTQYISYRVKITDMGAGAGVTGLVTPL